MVSDIVALVAFDEWVNSVDAQQDRQDYETLGRSLQKLERVQRLLQSARDTATGIIMSPYVGAVSAVQGCAVGMLDLDAE